MRSRERDVGKEHIDVSDESSGESFTRFISPCAHGWVTQNGRHCEGVER